MWKENVRKCSSVSVAFDRLHDIRLQKKFSYQRKAESSNIFEGIQGHQKAGKSFGMNVKSPPSTVIILLLTKWTTRLGMIKMTMEIKNSL
jgi:hypothetical protein